MRLADPALLVPPICNLMGVRISALPVGEDLGLPLS